MTKQTNNILKVKVSTRYNTIVYSGYFEHLSAQTKAQNSHKEQ